MGCINTADTLELLLDFFPCRVTMNVNYQEEMVKLRS